MSRKMGYHLTPCNDGNPLVRFLGALFVLGLIFWAVDRLCVYIYHHVILPAIHIALMVLLYGSMALGALVVCLLVLGLIIWTRKREARRHVQPVPVSISADRIRPRLASQNDVPAISAQAGTAYKANSEGTIISSPDGAWAFMHGIDWDK